jgi:hypothetical protein
MKLTAAQTEIVQDKHRFKVVIAGRRFGKTHLAVRELCYNAKEPNKEVWYVTSSYRAAKMIAWKKLRQRLIELRWIQKINESELTITLKNGSTIALKGADNPDSLRGVGLDYLVIDEVAEVDPEAFYEVLRPTLADKQGSALFIGTPKGSTNWAKDLFDMEIEFPEQWKSFSFTTIQGGNVPAEEIEAARRDLDIRTFRQEFEATFESYAGRIYYAFDRKENVKPFNGPVPDILYIGCDFNVGVMSAVVMAREGDTLHVIDEIAINESNTNELVDEVRARYPKQKIMCYPDPAGRQRKTSASGMTDIIILQNAGFVVKAPNSHNPVRDGINAVNARLCDTMGERKLFVDPKCRETLNSLERFAYKEGTNQPDKDSGYDHMSDALRYAVEYLFPLKKDHSNIEQPARWGLNTGVRK